MEQLSGNLDDIKNATEAVRKKSKGGQLGGVVEPPEPHGRQC